MDDAAMLDGLEDITPPARDRPWAPPSVEDHVTWGKHRGISYLDLARRDRGYTRWAATTIGGLKGQLCAEALAICLGVTE